MKKDIVTAIAFGITASWLPFWEWGGLAPRPVGAFYLAIMAFIALMAMTPDQKKGGKRHNNN